MSSDKPALHPETLAAQGLGRIADPYRDIVPPIHVSTTYERGADGAYPGGRVYSRADNPSYDRAEALIASLEGAAAAMLFASGQAAAAAVFQALAPGDRVLAPRHMYWALRKWLLEFAAPWGLAIEFYENASIDDLAAKARARRPRLIWIETPANPTWDVTDIAAACDIAREVRRDRRRRFDRGDADADASARARRARRHAFGDQVPERPFRRDRRCARDGAATTRLWQRIRYFASGGGAVLGPFEAWLLLRGMRTLHLRVAAACDECARDRAAAAGPPRLSHVLYPGACPRIRGTRSRRGRCTADSAAMMSLRLRDGEEAAHDFTARLRVFKRATSLGSVESLVEHRASVEGPGTLCPPDLVRLSIGVEHVDDLIEDIEAALR